MVAAVRDTELTCHFKTLGTACTAFGRLFRKNAGAIPGKSRVVPDIQRIPFPYISENTVLWPAFAVADVEIVAG